MFKLADLFVQISGNSTPLNATLGGIKGQLLGIASQAAKTGPGMSGMLGNVAAAGGRVAAALGGTAAAVAGIAAAVVVATYALHKCAYAASELNESISKTEQIFGSSSDKIIARATQMARSFGIPRKETLEAASSYALMFQNAGIATEDATKMSLALTKLAADAARFNNASTNVAYEKFRAGISGEMMPLREWGVRLSEEAVKNKAFAMGLASGTKQLDERAKMIARVAILQQSLAKANGALERESGNYGAQWERFYGTLQTIVEDIGSVVLPAFEWVFGHVNDLLADFGGWVGWATDKWHDFMKAIGQGEGGAERRQRLADVDARNQQIEADAAKENAMAAQGNHKQSAFRGGLVEYYNKIAEAAAGNGAVNIAKQQAQGINKLVDLTAQLVVQGQKKSQNGAAAALAS